ncbi:MAG: hypothetical protein GX146_00185, partial [Myxococcales bacterium]|nr:hypothetical protein [Myxococcales bacterium]
MTRKPITPKPITPKKNARKIATQSAASCKPVASPWSLSRLVAWLPLVAVLFMAGCVDEDSPTMYAMCGGEHEDVEIKRLVNGNLVIVANYREEGFN